MTGWTLAAAVVAIAAVGCGEMGPCERATAGFVCAVAGTGNLGFNQDGRRATQTDFFLPSRARYSPEGLLYIMDFNNWRLRRVEDNGRVQTFAGNGAHAAALPGLPAADSPLDNPIDFDFLSDGAIVLVSPEDPRVLLIDGDGTLQVLAGRPEPGIAGNEGDGGDPLNAWFIRLDGVAVGADGTIYLSDSEANRVRAIRDGIITTVVGSGAEGYTGDGGPATAAALNYPTGVTVDADGVLFVADSLNHVIRRVTSDGIIDTIAGIGEEGFAGDGGPATAAALNEPYGVAVGSDGSVYVADRSNFRVRRIDIDGTIDTIAGTTEGHSGDGGPAAEAQFGFLGRITLEGDALLVADQSNGCIRQIVLDPEMAR